jgi:hypothetical protein
VLRRICVVGVALALAAPVLAQGQGAGAGVDQRFQVHVFEGVLRQAIQHGGEQLANQMSAVIPGVALLTGGEPIARGLPLPEYGVVFQVQIPYLLQTVQTLWQMSLARPGLGVATVTQQTGRVTANSMPSPDSMRSSKPWNPDEAYTTLVRDALIDAMLDNSGPLGIKDDGRLVVAASAPNGSESMILTIKGSDLTAFRQGKMPREEARKRVEVTQF